ncbi:NAD(P)H-dependent oxidoreductase [Acetobacter sp. TBRC 12305]|uniref:NAD(P)H-dependent oxidoreductase n=1 Tax=Acetobacter garciniae TaxID=2817435 RepID=A0A939HNU9_9PROT|nr:NAD(P)H-dependent oxidoreductase [Acetobacter garciniae]MBO1325776.1 NAD(P)H-dependent oxidoreductase [Acetobacter garciniae]MBX0345676.1 NAD(P)H-dependent oxidoreductase [Acetobacter garciniae]
MNVLIVYAHPEPKSYNGAMKDIAVRTLLEQGHVVTVSDLYAMNFSPVLGVGDFPEGLQDPSCLNLAKEQTYAYEAGTLSADIRAEQEKLRQADLVIFQFPIWWFGMPAIMKGWADRVFARGFAYSAGRKYDTGLFRGKTAMVAATTGTSADTYAPDGIDGDILSVLWPVHNGLLRYTGFDVISPFIAYMPGRMTEHMRTARLEEYRQRLQNLDRTPRLFFHPAADYGPNERLLPGVLARSGIQRNV